MSLDGPLVATAFRSERRDEAMTESYSLPVFMMTFPVRMSQVTVCPDLPCRPPPAMRYLPDG